MEKRPFGKMAVISKGPTLFIFFNRTQVTKGGLMIIALQIVVTILIFLGGYFLGKVLRKKPHSSGRLIIDEKGETERWTFMVDDDIEDIKNQSVIFMDIELRA